MQYLQKMATVILVASIIIWALGYFPRTCEEAELIAQEIELVEAKTDISEEEKIKINNILLTKNLYNVSFILHTL